MTTTTASHAHTPVRATTTASQPATTGAPIPTGLWILLGAFTTLAINIAVVLYMASQMPH